MKKSFGFIAMAIVIAMLLPIYANANSLDNVSINSAQDSQDEEITELLEERQLVLMKKPVDIVELNRIDLELYNLGVTFLAEAEVAADFPEAKSAVTKNTMDATADVATSADSSSRAGVIVPESDINSWMSYRTSNYYYNGKKYNIQRLVAQPLDEEESPLWDESADSVEMEYSLDWEAGATTFMQSIASVGLSALAPVTSTIYDVLSSTWDALQPISTIDPGKVIYRYENSTTTFFFYVRLESQTDYDQKLAMISSQCHTSVAYIVDVDEWSQNGDGTESPVPAQIAGTREIVSTPPFYRNISKACDAYESWSGGPTSNQISRITISGPESKVVVTIYPHCSLFPDDLET